MPAHFECRFMLGDRVRWYGLTATVCEVRFSAKTVRYELQFDTGGARAIVDCGEIGEVE